MSFLSVSFMSLILTVLILTSFSWLATTYSLEMNLICINFLEVPLSFSLDWPAKLFLLVVLSITTSVYLYCWSYMNSDLSAWRFIFLVSIFVLSMVLLVSGSSLSALILGWDGLGLSSYYLVIYYQNFKSNLSGFITVVSNRIGDVFIIAFILMVLISGTSGFWSKSPSDFALFKIMALLVLLSAITKSALFPYCTWLPEAMAAPTPVSSLVHSSTLVTAGVYILYRYSFCLDSVSLMLLSAVSAFTLLISSSAAIFCQDFKKVIALSTLSQLAFMGLTLALGFSVLAFYHLITHAMFKSCLFMGAGSLLHLAQSNQDMRWSTNSKASWGNTLAVALPIMALVALPFTSGYYSKELILLTGLSSPSSGALFLILFSGAVFTLLYSARLLNNLSLVESTNKVVALFEDIGVLISIILVLVLAVVGGWYLSWYSFDWFSVESPWLVLLLQSALVSTLVLWASYVFIFNSSYSHYWSTFGYLAPLSSHESAKVLMTNNLILQVWEMGWVETIGPTLIQNLTQASTRLLYTLALVNYKTLLTLLFLTSFSILTLV